MALAVLVAGAILADVIRGDRTYLYVLGGLGVALGLTAAIIYYVARQRTQAASLKPCSHCAEQVKVEAKVCRYCGFRFPLDPRR